MQTKIRTVQQHILDEERLHPGATGDFTALLTTLTLSAKIISREVNKAGLVKILGETGDINVHGEAVQKLDEFAQQTIYRAMGHNGHLCVMASEESADIIPLPAMMIESWLISLIFFDSSGVRETIRCLRNVMNDSSSSRSTPLNL